MRLRMLIVLALILVVAPISLTWLIGVFWKPLFAFGKLFVETIGMAQMVALLLLSPIIAATRLFEWAKRRGFI